MDLTMTELSSLLITFEVTGRVLVESSFPDAFWAQ